MMQCKIPLSRIFQVIFAICHFMAVCRTMHSSHFTDSCIILSKNTSRLKAGPHEHVINADKNPLSSSILASSCFFVILRNYGLLSHDCLNIFSSFSPAFYFVNYTSMSAQHRSRQIPPRIHAPHYIFDYLDVIGKRLAFAPTGHAARISQRRRCLIGELRYAHYFNWYIILAALPFIAAKATDCRAARRDIQASRAMIYTVAVSPLLLITANKGFHIGLRRLRNVLPTFTLTDYICGRIKVLMIFLPIDVVPVAAAAWVIIAAMAKMHFVSDRHIDDIAFAIYGCGLTRPFIFAIWRASSLYFHYDAFTVIFILFSILAFAMKSFSLHTVAAKSFILVFSAAIRNLMVRKLPLAQ